MYHYFICCKLKFDLHKNYIYIQHTHCYKLTFQNFLKLFLVKIYYLYAQKINIHLYQKNYM
jgi:hypothetical protein